MSGIRFVFAAVCKSCLDGTHLSEEEKRRTILTLDEEVRAAKQKLQERRQFSDAAVTAWIKQEEAESTYGAVGRATLEV